MSETHKGFYAAHQTGAAHGIMYLTSGSSSMANVTPRVGAMIGPRQNGFVNLREGRLWAADNDAYSGKFETAKFARHLERMAPFAATCLFFVAPDVIQDFGGTAGLFDEWGPRIREAGYPVAWVAHDGALPGDIPDCDCVFLGGTTPWKLSSAAHAICQEARERGLWVHMGKVNSKRRTVTAAKMGVQSVDGTHMVYVGKDQAFKEFRVWTGEASTYAGTPLLIHPASADRAA